ncbi:hypothetical protein [Brevibacillus sp. SYSU BS000544]|uniref:hypothetical protein n=1 Tax=Brevibacillus sp. SYSU BS000544 TaxID=3416443 RepID=UPI003CE5B3CD
MKKSMVFSLFVALSIAVSGCGNSTKETASTDSTATNNEEVKKKEEEANAKAEAEAKAKAEAEAKKKEEEEAAKKAEEESKYKNAYFFANEIPQIDKEQFGNEGTPLSDKSIEFLKKNISLLPAWKPELVNEVNQKVDSKITYKHLEKNIDKYLEKFIKVTGYIVEIEEYQSDIGEVSYIHVVDDEEESYVFLYPGTGELLKDDDVTAVGIPLQNTSFANVSGGTTRVVMAACSYIQKNQ